MAPTPAQHVAAEPVGPAGPPTYDSAESEATEEEAPTVSRRAARRAARARRSVPRLPAQLALVLTGLVVGLAGSLLTWAALNGCEAVRGTSSCGGGPGLLLLVVIFVVMVALGAGLLRAGGIPEARGTSLLAVGLLTVVVMVVLMNAVFSSWMFVAVPVVSAAAYVLAGWVSTRLVETTDDGPEHDIR